MVTGWRFEEVKCGICGSGNSGLLYKKRGIETGFLYNIVRCRECGFVYVSPRLTSNSLLKLYDKDYYHKENFIKQATFDEREKGIETEKISLIESVQCRKKFQKGQTLLDVGCGLGGLLYDAKRVGYKVTGIEWSDDAYNYLRNRGLDVYLGEFENIDLGGKKFDVITAIAVLEHMRNPMPFFEKVSDCLNKGGIFYYVTASRDSLFARISGRNWGFLEPDMHINYFTQDSVISCFKKVGLRPAYLKGAFDTGRTLTRQFIRLGVIKEGANLPKTLFQKITLGALTLFDNIRNINLPYAVKD